jgi:hypothetical protein
MLGFELHLLPTTKEFNLTYSETPSLGESLRATLGGVK